MEVAMLTYSTRARGGVAHALKLAEHLATRGVDVTLHSLAREDD
ncbi:MAG: MSMEG_0565 family glycosyltransferase, partial [Thermoplasmata archaeon]|nr:MSMEG_0565 family glycosyltransferase [Thermoplasmata archaeon]